MWSWFATTIQGTEEITYQRILITIWSLWHARIQHVMEGKQQTVQGIVGKIESLMRDLAEIRVRLPKLGDQLPLCGKPLMVKLSRLISMLRIE